MIAKLFLARLTTRDLIIYIKRLANGRETCGLTSQVAWGETLPSDRIEATTNAMMQLPHHTC